MAKERPPIEEMTLRQLRKVAAEYEISRYSRMRKSQLLKAIQSAKLGDLVGQHEQKTEEERQTVEAKKFELGQPTGVGVAEATELAMVDWNLGDLPDGYDEARIVLLPRDPQWAYAYWDIPDRDKEACRRQGGQQLALRIYDATDLNLDYQMPHTVQEYACDEMAREWYLPIPLSDRSYVVEIGYRCNDGRWLMLARSSAIHVPPVYPTDWSEDYFLSIPWEQNLIGRTFFTLMPKQRSVAVKEVHDEAISEQRQPGSIYGSMQLAESAISSFASGAGMSAVAGSAQMTASGAGMLTVAGSAQMTASGAGMLAVSGSAQMTASGVGMLTVPGSMQMSGVGLETGLRVPGSIQFTASGMGFL
ncbi:MAG: Rho termination protein, partial [Cyanobacteria bacterium M5B4]